jgi:AcrR family transcriptional regulator
MNQFTRPQSSPLALASRETLTKAEQSRRTRSLIIETGIRCLVEYGYAQTGMHLISKEAGISRGPLHYHFEDRNALMAAIAEALPLGASEDVVRRLRSAKTLEARLTTIIDIALEQHMGPHHFAAMELLMAARQDHDLAAAIAPHFRNSEEALDTWWCEYLALLRWPREKLLAFRAVIVACLRGLALDHVLNQNNAAHAAAVTMLRDIFLHFAHHEK